MEERMISEFNEAQLQIFRLHQLWVSCRHFRESGNLIEWRWILDSARIELEEDAYRLDKKEKKNYLEMLNKVDEEIVEALEEREKLYQKLKEKEILLRHIQNEAGKGSKYKPQDEDMMR